MRQSIVTRSLTSSPTSVIRQNRDRERRDERRGRDGAVLPDERARLPVQIGGAKGPLQARLPRPLVGAFSLDLQEAQPPVEMMAQAHFVAGTPVAPVIVIQLPRRRIEILCVVARQRPAGRTGPHDTARSGGPARHPTRGPAADTSGRRAAEASARRSAPGTHRGIGTARTRSRRPHPPWRRSGPASPARHPIERRPHGGLTAPDAREQTLRTIQRALERFAPS